jgi:hypothetical protein
MARTNIAAQTLPGAYPVLPVTADSVDLTVVPADVANGNETALVNDRTIVFCDNTGASPRTITFTSVADTLNRTGDITAYTVGAGQQAIWGPFKTVGWAQSGGKLWIDGAHAELVLAVITLPA